MKLTTSTSLVLAFLIMLLFSACNESKSSYKIPGSYESLQLVSASRAYPAEDIPRSAYGDARAYHDGTFGPTDQRKSDNEPWEAVGPLNTSGRCLALAINPQADSTVYLGSASGGLWRSRRLGRGISWEYVPTMDDVLGVSSIAFAPDDSTVMYIGTGEVYNPLQTGNDGAYRATRGSYGVGILKSTDGGNTWNKSLDWSYENQKAVQSIQVNKDNPKRVYAATTDGVYYSENSGDTWELVLDIPMATDVEINGDIIIAACGNLGRQERGIFRSFNNGQNWSRYEGSDFPNFQGKIELASAPSDPNTVYASVGNGFSGADGATWLFKTTNAGASWELKNTTDYSMWQGWFSHDVAVHPTNPRKIMAVGIDVHKSTTSGVLLAQKSNGGVALGTPEIGVPDGSPSYSHSDHHVALYHPNLENVILFGNDGGMFISVDDGETFQSANGGLQTTQFYNGFSVSHQDPDFALGGLQDNSTALFRGTGAWQRAIGGDGSWTAIDFENDNNVFGSSQFLRISASRNRGLNFSSSRPSASGDNPLFIAPFVIAQSDPSIMYAGGSFLFKSTNGGQLWSTTNENSVLNGDPIYAIDVSPTNADVVYAATAPFLQQSSLFISKDGGQSFTSTDPSQFPDRFINDIAIDPSDESIVYITMSGFGSGHLFVSEDYGETFTDITNGLPDVPSNALAIDPMNTDHLYFGNDMGVYFSSDQGENWESFQDGLMPSVIAMDLKVSPSDRKLWVATHGNGAFRRDLVDPMISSTQEQFSSIANIYPNPGNGIELKINSESPISHYEVLSIDGKTITKRSPLNQNAIFFNNPLNSGSYILRFFDDRKLIGTEKYNVQ